MKGVFFFLRFYESNAFESAAELFDSEMELSAGPLTYSGIKHISNVVKENVTFVCYKD